MQTGPQQIDRRARDNAARLLRQYVAGEISGGRVEEDWPGSEDAAVSRIGYEILPGIRGGMLDREYSDEFRQCLRKVLRRCELFLGSDLPYGWGSLGPGSCTTLGCVSVILIVVAGTIFAVLGWSPFGLGLLVLTAIVAWLSTHAGMMAAFNPPKIRSMADGYLRLWPFESETDYRAVLEGRDPFEAAERETFGPPGPRA